MVQVRRRTRWACSRCRGSRSWPSSQLRLGRRGDPPLGSGLPTHLLRVRGALPAGAVRHSTGSVADCFDSAMAESFFATPEQARQEIFTFIEGWYNPRRQHSALGGTGPRSTTSGSSRSNDERVRGGPDGVGFVFARPAPPRQEGRGPPVQAKTKGSCWGVDGRSASGHPASNLGGPTPGSLSRPLGPAAAGPDANSKLQPVHQSGATSRGKGPAHGHCELAGIWRDFNGAAGSTDRIERSPAQMTIPATPEFDTRPETRLCLALCRSISSTSLAD